MSRRARKPAPIPTATPEPAPRPLRESDAEFLAALRQAADHLAMRGEPEPGLPTIVRIAASELERRYLEEAAR